MKWFLLIQISLLFTIQIACLNNTGNAGTKSLEKKIARCYGNSPCNACTTCNYCKWCNAGGTCGICEKQKKATSKKTNNRPDKVPSSTSSQCKAITKKGSRCSRSARSAGYCSQHGG